uniref:Uncharacterized protein n=1 Tax=Panagrolaimus sp. ES5 TaxID=591445 RepID=A0AC34GTC0_9BILA
MSDESITLISCSIPEFQVEVGVNVINGCRTLKNAVEYCNNVEPITVPLKKNQLETLVKFYQVYQEIAYGSHQWIHSFFENFTDEELLEFAKTGDYLHSNDIFGAIAIRLSFKLENMSTHDLTQFLDYLNIVDDYTPEERILIQENPLKFFAERSKLSKVAKQSYKFPSAIMYQMAHRPKSHRILIKSCKYICNQKKILMLVSLTFDMLV